MKYTKLRHQVLDAISIGQVRPGSLGYGWVIKASHSTYVQMARAVNSLVEAGLAEQSGAELIPTTAGNGELYRWNARYGQVRPGTQTEVKS